jgi:purine-cytosine permease-like protein
MDTTQSMQIAGAVVVLVQIAKAAGVTGRWALLIAIALSAGSMAVWAYSTGDFTRENSWSYFVAFGSVLTSAVGVFGLVNASPEQVTAVRDVGARMKEAIKGTGDQ